MDYAFIRKHIGASLLLSMLKGAWWKGLLNGKIGMFPSNFVQLIQTPASQSQSQLLAQQQQVLMQQQVQQRAFQRQLQQNPNLLKSLVRV